jgi:hypothetical protein
MTGPGARKEPRWLRFEGTTAFAGPRTDAWYVVSKEQDAPLGVVKWYGPFRCYAFYPWPDTVYERTCLRDIADFCEAETVKRRQRKTDAAVTP